MPLFANEAKTFAEKIRRIIYCNPFAPERITYEREILGDTYQNWQPYWSKTSAMQAAQENLAGIMTQVQKRVESVSGIIRHEKKRPDETEKDLYLHLVLFHLFHYYSGHLDELITKMLERPEQTPQAGFYRDFEREALALLNVRGNEEFSREEVARYFSFFFQLRRAFYHIFQCIIGATPPAARLRAAVWESIFTHDMARYSRVLYDRMSEVSCLITGPSGAGKELVARAIGMSSYIPFDPQRQRFIRNFAEIFFPLHLAALSPTLIESELFGHRAGSFTGAVEDREGWFEVCPEEGAVFLDEIGEVSMEVQVKLLRVLETRQFQRIGDHQERLFPGKIIAATNRLLDHEIQEKHFREDLYYRLCSDRIVVPSLREHLDQNDAALGRFVAYIAGKIAGPEEAGNLTEEATRWIEKTLGTDYGWPGNFRELEQCVRNILIRGNYQPLEQSTRWPVDALLEKIRRGQLDAETLLQHYCSLVFYQAGSYQEASRRLGLDHRTVKSKIDEKWLAELQGRNDSEGQ